MLYQLIILRAKNTLFDESKNNITMKTLTNLLSATLILLTISGEAQNIINGSFEDNTLSVDFGYGFTAESFVNSVSNIYTFGSSDTLMLCMQKNDGYDGNWSLILYNDYLLVEDSEDNNRPHYVVSLKLSESLNLGETYKLSLYTKRHVISQFPPILAFAGDLSSSIRVGYANDSSSTNITYIDHSIEQPNSYNEWEHQSLEFICNHENINYITIETSPTTMCGPRYTCQIDYLNLESVSAGQVGISESENKLDISFYPNPIRDFLHIDYSSSSEVILYDIMGKEKHRQKLSDAKTNTLLLESLTNGLYFLNIWQEDRLISQEKILKM